jgi:anti-anti-sigma factor
MTVLDSKGALVVLIGAFDLAARPKISATFDALADESIVGLDLERTTYIDSIALGCIIRLNTDLNERGGRMFLTGASPSVKRILEVTGLSSMFLGAEELDASLARSGDARGALRRYELHSDVAEQ